MPLRGGASLNWLVLAVSMQVPCFESFQHQGTHEHLGNLLDMHFHISYTLRNLLYVELMQFVLLYIHPMVPFQAHLLDMHEHIGYIQYMNRKFLLSETYEKKQRRKKITLITLSIPKKILYEIRT